MKSSNFASTTGNITYNLPTLHLAALATKPCTSYHTY